MSGKKFTGYIDRALMAVLFSAAHGMAAVAMPAPQRGRHAKGHIAEQASRRKAPARVRAPAANPAH
jgi:hypothetical protein